MATRTTPSTSPATSKRTKRAAPPATTIILVRHGQTPSTGKVLPGRAPGLHLADVGCEQAERAAARIAELDRVDAVYTSPLERARETAAPIGRARGMKPVVERGLLECDFGEWTGAELKALWKLPEWTTVQRAPSTFTFPGGESFSAMQHRIVGAIDKVRATHPGGTVVCVSHADPIKAAVAHALGTHLDLFQRIVISTCAISVLAYTTAGPTVLAVNSTGGSLKELHPSCSAPFYEFDEVDTFTAAAIGEPGSRVFYLHARAGQQRVTVKCEKQQVTAIAAYLRRVLSDLPPPEDRPLPLDLRDPGEQAFVLGPIGLGYDRGNDRLLVQLEEISPPGDEDDDEEEDETALVDDDPDRGHVRLYVTRSQAAAFCEYADELVAAGRPNCQWCGNPIDPDGHPCPRMN